MCAPSILNYIKVEHLTPVQKAEIKKELVARRRDLDQRIKAVDRVVRKISGKKSKKSNLTKKEVRQLRLASVTELHKTG